jgi:hypothetical protein
MERRPYPDYFKGYGLLGDGSSYSTQIRRATGSYY